MWSEIQYFPSVEFFSKMKACDSFEIEQFEHYQKGGLRNRCFILSANGRLPLSVPLKKGKNSQQPIRDVRVAYDVNWQLQHWLSIQSAYGKAAFFCDYESGIKELLSHKQEFLLDYNLMLLDALLKMMQLPVAYTLTEKFKFAASKTLEDGCQKIETSSKPYQQVFSDRFDFEPNLSVVDLIFNVGPETYYYV